ncbi:MAG: hypothetical protein ACO3Q7_08640 [Steroidobacteraceae bacterium]
MTRKLLKVLHELGGIGVIGALACCLVLVATAPVDSLAGYAAVREGIHAITRWVLMPSLLAVLVSGILALVLTPAYMEARWAWLKAVLGLAMFEGTLLTVQATSRDLAAMATEALASGVPDAEAVAPLLRTEWRGLWTMLVLSLLNVLLAVWRPRFRRRSRDASAVARQ